MSEFTKGKWKVIKSTPIEAVIGSDSESLRIVLPREHVHQSNLEHEANAHLIAASPAMYAAIEAALRVKDLWTYNPDDYMSNETEGQALSRMLQMFEDVIALASPDTKTEEVEDDK